jgi:nucleotide-binding universal stress UspA family protein
MEGTTLSGRIVVGVDGSPASAQALSWALNQGALTGAAVEAVNAWQVPQVPGGLVSTMGVDLSTTSREILRNAVEAVGASPESVTERTVQDTLSRSSSMLPTVLIS